MYSVSKYFVISGNHDEYLSWRKENRIRLLEDRIIQGTSDLVYVSGPHVLKGVRDPRGIFIGTWKERRDIEQILVQLRISTTDIGKTKILRTVWETLRTQDAYL